MSEVIHELSDRTLPYRTISAAYPYRIHDQEMSQDSPTKGRQV